MALIENLFDLDTVKGHFTNIMKYLLNLHLIEVDKQYSGRVSIVLGLNDVVMYMNDKNTILANMYKFGFPFKQAFVAFNVVY